jgi:hypothetical protein
LSYLGILISLNFEGINDEKKKIEIILIGLVFELICFIYFLIGYWIKKNKYEKFKLIIFQICLFLGELVDL